MIAWGGRVPATPPFIYKEAVPADRLRDALRLHSVPPEPASETITAESLAIQIIQENNELAGRYAGGDLTALETLEEKALALAAGRLSEHEVKDTLMRKLGASI